MNMERVKPTRSGLFAIELLIAVGVFSLCAAICVGLFVRSEVMSQDSADLNRAVSEARSAAECFKAAGGDLERTAQLTGGQMMGDTVCVSYDEAFGYRKRDVGEEVVGFPYCHFIEGGLFLYVWVLRVFCYYLCSVVCQYA